MKAWIVTLAFVTALSWPNKHSNDDWKEKLNLYWFDIDTRKLMFIDSFQAVYYKDLTGTQLVGTFYFDRDLDIETSNMFCSGDL